ncbi:hypothetical protein Hanom_Chr16g01417731 [Helianthus anomalus]
MMKMAKKKKKKNKGEGVQCTKKVILDETGNCAQTSGTIWSIYCVDNYSVAFKYESKIITNPNLRCLETA